MSPPGWRRRSNGSGNQSHLLLAAEEDKWWPRKERGNRGQPCIPFWCWCRLPKPAPPQQLHQDSQNPTPTVWFIYEEITMTIMMILLSLRLQYDLYLHCRGLLWNQVSSRTVQSHDGMDHCCVHTGGMPGYSDGHKILGNKLKTKRCYCIFPLAIPSQDKPSTVALNSLNYFYESGRLLTEHLRILKLCKHSTDINKLFGKEQLDI